MYPFRRLAAWRRAHALALHVFELTERLRPGSHGAVLDHMKRAALSIPSSIAKGCGGHSDPQLARFLQIALSSARELHYHALLAYDLRLLASSEYARVEARVDEVCRILVALLRRVLDRRAAQSRRKITPAGSAGRPARSRLPPRSYRPSD